MQTETTDAAGPAGTPCAPRRGRPRSEAAEQAIVEAVERLMEGGAGLIELSIERIAAEAGVGKATIYRRWPNKEALLVDVFARLESPDPVPPTGGDVRDELIAMIEYMRLRGLAKRSRWVLRSALGQLESWPELRALYKDRIVRPRRELARQIIQRGVDQGVLRSDLEPELLAEILMGPILVRTLLWEESPLDDELLAERMVDAVLQGVAARPASASAASAVPSAVPPSGGESH
ncbi:TetR/AcrR family transcriptional regulator [Kitasatospora sp. NPDC096147]|uniref:TetR/AcrR family transcriptional regulator n=1 Tax=Kitasatospora sp. NPDC096147 TaxID=3364093 RepID=UPI0037FC65E3